MFCFVTGQEYCWCVICAQAVYAYLLVWQVFQICRIASTKTEKICSADSHSSPGQFLKCAWQILKQKWREILTEKYNRIWNDKLEGAEWQIGGGAKSALAFFWLTCAGFDKAKVGANIPLCPKKYASMGLKFRMKTPGAREEKLSALEAFVPPTHFVEWVGEPDYCTPS